VAGSEFFDRTIRRRRFDYVIISTFRQFIVVGWVMAGRANGLGIDRTRLDAT
jgi:hypothetical protein